MLSEIRRAVHGPLHDAIRQLSPALQTVIKYHMGWADSRGRSIEASGSKSIRPALALLSGRAGGGRDDDAMPGAIAVELLNNFSFLHDDVMDGDEQRRQRQTAWLAFGVGPAICAGDALLVLAHQVVSRSGSPTRLQALGLVQDTATEMISGQADDLKLQPARDLTVERWLHMAKAKTGALVQCSTSIGAILVGASEELISPLSRFGRLLGVAFQGIDDMLGIWGKPRQTGGRPVGFDIRAKQATLPVAIAFQHGGGTSEELEAIFRRGKLSDADVARASTLIERSGGRDGAMAETSDHYRAAVDVLASSSAPDSIQHQFLAIASLGLKKGL